MGKALFESDLDYIVDSTTELWEEVRDRKIFITGGTGFFGRWLLESFVRANSRLGLNSSAVVLTRNPEAFLRKAPHLSGNTTLLYHAGDVRSFDFPDGNFSHIIHAATGTDANAAVHGPAALFEGMVQGTRRTLEFARSCGARKFLLTSSGAVYGKQPPELARVPEEYRGAPDTVDPASAYGEAKRVSEFLAAAHAGRYGFEAKIARCFAFVGPHLPLDANYAAGNFIGNVLRNEPICVAGDGTPYRSYLYAADLAIWLWTILFRGVSCRPYNVGSSSELTIAELARVVAEVSHTPHPIRIALEASPGRQAERYVPSTTKVERELGLSQKIDLHEAIRRSVSWYSGRSL